MWSPSLEINEFHILNGDILAQHVSSILKQSQVCVARELLMEGPVNSAGLSEFWDKRAAYIEDKFGGGKSEYYDKVVSEFEKINNWQNTRKIFLWFEYNLLCQVNLWFTINLILTKNRNYKMFWVRPKTQDWKGFDSCSTEQLIELKLDACQLSDGEIQSLIECWKAYQTNDKVRFQKTIKSASIEFLKEVSAAHFSRIIESKELTRPEKSLVEISNSIHCKDFETIFPLFSAKEEIFGYRDLQVNKLWSNILNTHPEYLN